MVLQKDPQQVSFRGEIIEIVEQKGEKVLTVNLFPRSINIPIHGNDGPHLGDLVSFDATIKVRNVERVIPTD